MEKREAPAGRAQPTQGGPGGDAPRPVQRRRESGERVWGSGDTARVSERERFGEIWVVDPGRAEAGRQQVLEKNRANWRSLLRLRDPRGRNSSRFLGGWKNHGFAHPFCALSSGGHACMRFRLLGGSSCWEMCKQTQAFPDPKDALCGQTVYSPALVDAEPFKKKR